MREFTIDEIQAVMAEKGYTFFDNHLPYNVNIIGIRNANQVPEQFDDSILLIYRNNQLEWQLEQMPATTDPGLYWLQNPMNDSGTAILVPGQYRGAYMIGKHKDYKALEQKKEMTYVRDNDKDHILDLALMHKPGEQITDNIKTNIHRASSSHKSKYVGKWSAGCQVVADPEDHVLLLQTCEIAREQFGNSFTYTLLTIEDFE